MSSSLLNGFHTAWASQDPRTALKLSSQAPAFLKSQPSKAPSFPSSLFLKPETPELWLSYEKLFLACLRTGDDASAKECLRRLTDRFGANNHRILGLHGLYEEATAKNKGDLERILKAYEDALEKNPVNVPIAKRRIALLRSLNRPDEAIKALVALLEAFPTDGEAWVELSNLYRSQGLFSQAIFSLQEALLNAPNAWNLHARLGELLYTSAGASDSDDALKDMADSSTAKLGSMITGKTTSAARNENILPSRETLDQLNTLATDKLREIVAKQASKRDLDEELESELIAAQQLLDQDGATKA
ncbi:hypothetical protein KEM56_006437 [Ascosphaera pollenicola]|nr:hypothetical protein KEM56_006437 [Ascosphaera pollenicola]